MNQSALITIPTFNEAENICRLADQLLELYPNIHVAVVDDASPDGTAQAVRQLQAKFPGRLHVIERSGKGGRGSAVLEGFRFGLARDYALFFEMDADFSHNPKEIPHFLQKLEEGGYDAVFGSRYLPGSQIFDWGWKRTFFSKWANRYAKLVLGIPITDYTNGYRCYTRRTIESLRMDLIDAKGYVVLSEVAYQLFLQNKKLGEIPTIFVNRRRGISNLGWHEIREAFMSVLRIRFKRAYRSRLNAPQAA